MPFMPLAQIFCDAASGSLPDTLKPPTVEEVVKLVTSWIVKKLSGPLSDILKCNPARGELPRKGMDYVG
jgi:hypothetical protein